MGHSRSLGFDSYVVKSSHDVTWPRRGGAILQVFQRAISDNQPY